MEDTKSVFDARCVEIKHYMDFIKTIEPERTYIDLNETDITGRDQEAGVEKAVARIPISNETKKIFKANVYLLLYNLVESTVRNTLKAIYDHLKMKGVSFHDMRDELQLEVLNNLKRYIQNKDVVNFNQQINDISKDIVYMTFNPNDRFNGNVDAKIVREKVEKMGFSVVADAFSRDGFDLESIKQQRNSLAHGDLSFCDCGKDLVASELDDMFERTKSYLAALIQCSENYIAQELYKKQ